MKFDNLNKFEKVFFKRLFNYYDNEIEPDKLNIIENKEYDKEKRVSIYQTPFNSIIFAATPIYKHIKNIIDTEKADSSLSMVALQELTDYNNFQDEDKTICLGLNPNNYLEVESPRNFEIRKLGEKDKKAFLEFKEECPQEDLEEGQVSFADPIVIGCFDGKRITAAASYWFWGNGLADIGVVVQPEYRKKGIGRAIISRLAGYGLELDRINVYRHNALNSASHNLALSLNFEEKMVIDSTRVLDI